MIDLSHIYYNKEAYEDIRNWPNIIDEGSKMLTLLIPTVLLHKDAKVPFKTHKGDLCYDISCVQDEDFDKLTDDTPGYMILLPENLMYSLPVSL